MFLCAVSAVAAWLPFSVAASRRPRNRVANVRRALAESDIRVDRDEAAAVLDAAHETLCPAAGD